MGATAYPKATTNTQATPTSMFELRPTSIPTRAATPASPLARPASLRRLSRSVGSNRSASSATNIGEVAIRIAASDEETSFHGQQREGHHDLGKSVEGDPAQSAADRARTPARFASGNSAAAPIVTRPAASAAGDMPPSTATLISP